jgi:glucuronokinase
VSDAGAAEWCQSDPMTSETVGRATARAGVAGNPSDALGGAALAVPVPTLGAEVRLRDADRVRVRRDPPEPGWGSVSELATLTARLGHDGGDRLVTAALVTLHRHLCAEGIEHDDAPFEAQWSTDIPRSVGLAGSSALVIATMRALAQRWRVDLPAPRLAELALRTEVDELGIAAGWMDRAVQAHAAPTLVDRRVDPDAALPRMEVIEPIASLELLVAWDPAGASPSGRLHGRLRERLAAGDPELVRILDELVDTARAAAAALAAADHGELAELVDRSCELRRQLGALDAVTAGLVEQVRAAGGAATSAGSGGAVLVVPSEVTASDLHDRLAAARLGVAPIPLGPDTP